MKIYKIERGSAAWDELAACFATESVHVIRIADDDGAFKVKANEWTWSPPLKTKKEAARR